MKPAELPESDMNERQPLFHAHSPFVWLALAGVIIMLDAHTKQWASETLILYRPLEVNGWLNWTLAHNYGAAFSLLSDAGGWQRWFLALVAAAVSLFIVVWLTRLAPGDRSLVLPLGLILGGGVGNLIDRVLLGHVVDFISLHYQEWYWPAFNLADSAITLGAILWLVIAFFGRATLDEQESVS